MNQVDTSMYNVGTSPNGSMNDPMNTMLNAVKLRNAMGNINKIRGGMPGTQGALGQLGGGQCYAPASDTGNIGE